MAKKKQKALIIPREVKIKLTRKNIMTGDFGNPKTCAIALAIKAKLGDHPEVDPDDGISITLPCGIKAIYDIPKKACAFILRFDDIGNMAESDDDEIKLRRALKPFTFVAKLFHAEFSS